MPSPVFRRVMLNARTTTGASESFQDNDKPPSFSANVAGTGSVSATVQIEVRNTVGGGWVLYGTMTMSGTTQAADAIAGTARYAEYRANVTAISGTGAAVTVTMGA